MNRKLIITSVGCFGLGALVSWAVTADIHEKKARRNRIAFRRVIDAQGKLIHEMHNKNLELMDGVQDHPDQLELPFNESMESLSTVEDDILLDQEGQPIEPININKVRLKSISLDKEKNAFGEGIEVEGGVIPPGETEEETRTNLQNLINQYTSNPDDVDVFVDAAGRVMAKDYTPPFVISRAKFAWDEEEGDDYEKITLTYYPDDRVLLDDADEPVDDINKMVGWKNLSRFGDESDDPEVVYIRNRQLRCDYEVVKDEENPLPLHVKYGMSKDEFATNKAAGLIKFRDDDRTARKGGR